MKILVKRNLKDYNSWKEMVSGNNELRKEKGSKGVSVYRSARDPNEVYLVFDWDDTKSYLDYFNLPDVQKVLEETGSTEVVEVSETFNLEA